MIFRCNSVKDRLKDCLYKGSLIELPKDLFLTNVFEQSFFCLLALKL